MTDALYTEVEICHCFMYSCDEFDAMDQCPSKTIERRSVNPIISWLHAELRGMQPRNKRLLSCAFMRTVWDALDARSRQAVLVAERLADGEATEEERMGFHDPERQEIWPARATCFADEDAAAFQTLRRLIEGRASHRIRFNQEALRYCIASAARGMSKLECSELLHGLARAAYDERLENGRIDPERLAILRDAVIDELEAPALIESLRTTFPVYRGFWCLEVLI